MDIETTSTQEVNAHRRPPNRLREFRRKAGYTQAALAEAAETTQSCIAAAEQTGKGIGDAKWKRLAEILNTDVLTLRGWTKVYERRAAVRMF